MHNIKTTLHLPNAENQIKSFPHASERPFQNFNYFISGLFYLLSVKFTDFKFLKEAILWFKLNSTTIDVVDSMSHKEVTASIHIIRAADSYSESIDETETDGILESYRFIRTMFCADSFLISFNKWQLH